LRLGASGEPRLLADVPRLADLVRTGFEQVRMSAAEHPVVARTVLERLAAVAAAAGKRGRDGTEIRRQARLMTEAVRGRVPNAEDADAVAALHARLFA
jgi:uncharacterized membrane protein